MILVALGACERAPVEPERSREERRGSEAIAPTETPPRWVAAARELEVESEDDESFEACVERVSNALPVEVAEGLFDIGYSAAAEDACVAKDAMKRRDAARCDALTMDGGARSCRRRIAVLTGNGDDCRSDEPSLGRDATCLAWTMRDAAICQAAPHAERALCEAVVRDDGAVCEREHGAARTRCSLERQRMAAAVRERPLPATRPPASATFTLVGSDDDEHPLGGVDLSPGVVVLRCGAQYRVLVRNASLLSPLALASALDAPVGSLVVDAERAGRVGFNDARVGFVAAYPNGESLQSDVNTRGFVRLRTFAPERGAQVAGDIELSLRASATSDRITARGGFHTFVRDVVDGGDACTTAPTSMR